MAGTLREDALAGSGNIPAIESATSVERENIDNVTRTGVRAAARVRLRQRMDLLCDLLDNSEARDSTRFRKPEVGERNRVHILYRAIRVRGREIDVHGGPPTSKVDDRYLYAAHAVVENTRRAFATQNEVSKADRKRTIENWQQVFGRRAEPDIQVLRSARGKTQTQFDCDAALHEEERNDPSSRRLRERFAKDCKADETTHSCDAHASFAGELSNARFECTSPFGKTRCDDTAP